MLCMFYFPKLEVQMLPWAKTCKQSSYISEKLGTEEVLYIYTVQVPKLSRDVSKFCKWGITSKYCLTEKAASQQVQW